MRALIMSDLAGVASARPITVKSFAMRPTLPADTSARAETISSYRRDMTEHTYRTLTTWTGSTDGPYAAYDRTHSVAAPPADATMRLSADPA